MNHATIRYKGREIQIKANLVDGSHISTISEIAKIIGNTFVPVRATLESAGLIVTWALETRTILITDPPIIFVTEDELEILYRITQAEAGGEDIKGRILVVNVIMNRVHSSSFPGTIKEVIFQENQFEPTRNGAFDRAVPSPGTKEAVHMALSGTDYSKGTLFFNAIRLRHTSWAALNREHAFDHGGHSFFF